MSCKIAAIYNVFDGDELLKHSINSVKSGVDLFIIVYQTTSNFGERYDPLPNILEAVKDVPHILHKFTPINHAGISNEREKRNIGLQIAKKNSCSHFLHMDCDEMYQDFNKAKKLYFDSGKEGSCCKIFTYFKLPTLRFETEDGYFVPFIHKLHDDTRSGVPNYPFYVDPTRRINSNNVELLDIHMHHFSWVRNNIERKTRNSSAKRNIERGTMLLDYYNSDVKAGFYVKDYEKKLIEVPNLFNIFV